MARLHRSHLARIVPLVIVAAALTACGSGDDSNEISEVRRYCELARQFDDVAMANGAATSPGIYVADSGAAGRTLEQMEPTLSELKASAPQEIRAEVEKTIEVLGEVKNGNLLALASRDFSDATRRTTDFRLRECPDAATSGEQ